MCASTFSCLIVFTLPRASEANMWGFFFFIATLISCQKDEIHKSCMGGEEKKNKTDLMSNTSGNSSRQWKSLGVIHSHPVLLTPADITAQDPLEEEFHRRRQNTLPGLGLHQRYLRNSAQNPFEEEEEHGPLSLGLTRGPPTRHCMLINHQQRF